MTTPPDDDYQWPTCTACHRDLWNTELGRQTCRPCEDRTRQRLTELPDLFTRLNQTATLMRGARPTGGSTSGTKTPPIPPRLEVLNLTAPGGAERRLLEIEDAWRAALHWSIATWQGGPAEALPKRVRFLTDNLPWACEQYDSVAQDIETIRRLHAECTAALTGQRRPGRIPIGFCPTPVDDAPCGADLTASTGSHRIRCTQCGTRWETVDDWKRLRADQQALLDTLESAA